MMDEVVDTIPAISIRQPWVYCILHGSKTIENRSWPTKYRGPILLHAGKALTKRDVAGVREFVKEHVGLEWLRLPQDPSGYPTGGIVGIADLVDCVERSDSPWFFGPYGFVLRNARPVPYVPCMGQLRLFGVPRALVAV